MRKKDRPKAIDLFAGCGGLTTGLKRAGFSVIAAVDLDDLAVASYGLNHQALLISKNIQAVRPKRLLAELGLKRGELDLLAGCPPCEGFSRLRTLNGTRRINDRRNDLIFEFVRFVRGMMPRCIMLENVPALATDKRMVRVESALTRLGYFFVKDVLDAVDYGVPQRRKRMVLLGSRLGPVTFASKARNRRTVRDAIQALPKPVNSDDTLHGYSVCLAKKVRKLIRAIPVNGGSRADALGIRRLHCHRRCDGFKDVYGRMAWDLAAPTITGGCINPSKGRFIHPSQHRPITLREAALLQTFPKRYRFELRAGRYAVAQLIGNAFPPEFAKRHAQKLIRHLTRTRHAKN
jgi:DNA (cytosine-5)-methyltransferase 1